MDKTLQMMKDLTDAPGVSGFEEPVRRVMRRYLEPLGDVTTDNLGSIIGRKVGKNGGPKVVLAGHMDEIGFMVTRITDEGYIKFQTLGGWWSQVMLAQRVEIYTRDSVIMGVIGSKPPHILSPDDRRKVYAIPQMFIDIGASSRQEVEDFGIRPGDPIVPVGPLTVMKNEKLLMAKAWDNRFGCALAIEVMRQLQDQEHPNEVYGVGNVQEEVGLRGATTTTNMIAPDIGFAVDTGIAGDTLGIEPDQASAKLGSGPIIVLYDGSMIPHVGLRNFVIDVAEAEGIPFQFDSIAGGGTDAGKMHVFGAGVPSLVIGVPVRYIHTHASILHRDDFDMAVKLLVEVIKRLDDEMVRQLCS